MKAVIATEEARPPLRRCIGRQLRVGCHVVPANAQGASAEPETHRGQSRVKGADTITVTRNEILYAFNQDDKFVLAHRVHQSRRHD